MRKLKVIQDGFSGVTFKNEDGLIVCLPNYFRCISDNKDIIAVNYIKNTGGCHGSCGWNIVMYKFIDLSTMQRVDGVDVIHVKDEELNDDN